MEAQVMGNGRSRGLYRPRTLSGDGVVAADTVGGPADAIAAGPVGTVVVSVKPARYPTLADRLDAKLSLVLRFVAAAEGRLDVAMMAEGMRKAEAINVAREMLRAAREA